MRKRFQNPPIAEAVFEVFVPRCPTWDEKTNELLASSFSKELNGRRENLQIHGLSIDFGPTGAKSIENSTPRTRLWNQECARMIQFGPEMCALNALPPYTQFEDYIPQFEALVRAYLSATGSQSLSWIGQRYINKVVLPNAEEDPQNIFSIYPNLPTEVREKHPPFAIQVEVMRLPEATITVNLQFQGMQAEGKPSYILDIYAKSILSMNANSSEIISWNNKIHDQLYRAFLFCIPEIHAKRLFKE